MRFYQKDSSEILMGIGSGETGEGRGGGDPADEFLILPGMKRRLYVMDPPASAEAATETTTTAAETTAAGALGIPGMDQDDTTSLLLQQPLSQQSSVDGGGGAGGGGVTSQDTNIRRQSIRKPSMDLSMGMADLVKGLHPTSRLVGKLHSLRAAQHHEDESGGGGHHHHHHSNKGDDSDSDPDDKWDWMTGVPTSLRFLAKSWRPIVRGPGGIVTEEPGSRASRVVSAAAQPDFSATVNMLAMLAKVTLRSAVIFLEIVAVKRLPRQ